MRRHVLHVLVAPAAFTIGVLLAARIGGSHPQAGPGSRYIRTEHEFRRY